MILEPAGGLKEATVGLDPGGVIITLAVEAAVDVAVAELAIDDAVVVAASVAEAEAPVES